MQITAYYIIFSNLDFPKRILYMKDDHEFSS